MNAVKMHLYWFTLYFKPVMVKSLNLCGSQFSHLYDNDAVFTDIHFLGNYNIFPSMIKLWRPMLIVLSWVSSELQLFNSQYGP